MRALIFIGEGLLGTLLAFVMMFSLSACADPDRAIRLAAEVSAWL